MPKHNYCKYLHSSTMQYYQRIAKLFDMFGPTTAGRTVRVQVRADHYSRLLQLAVTAGFDWVFYAAEDFVRMSVIPDGKPIIKIMRSSCFCTIIHFGCLYWYTCFDLILK